MFFRLSTAVLVAALSLAVMPAFAATPAPVPNNLGCAAGDPVVWLNTSSKVYHMSGDQYYGTTKSGKYLCKSAADAAGGHLAKASAVKTASPKGSPGAMMSPTPMPMATKTPKPKKKHATPAPSAAAT